ncbi:hypothetical protein KQH60_11615 [Mycetohabitans sp. B8]|uniref:hypothetical protein n=1 Tax=Mycetohabitans sp. B8 TaxID=2841845 RepID=UPI001F16BF2F|nr:hypothetical protein [Mycetohabitans sp. B8]MCG1043145.1 hypothetical protein [Mycetohabitans sp. B8]
MAADLKMTGCFTPLLSFIKKAGKIGKDCKSEKPSIGASTPGVNGKLNDLEFLGKLCISRPEILRMDGRTVLLKHDDNNEDGVQIKRGRPVAWSFNVTPAPCSIRATLTSNAGSTVILTSRSATLAQRGRAGSNGSSTEVESNKTSLSDGDKANATRIQNWTAGAWKKLERSNSMASLRKRLPRLTRSKSDPLPLSYVELSKQIDLQYRQLLSKPPEELKDVRDVQAAIPGMVCAMKWAESTNDRTLPVIAVICTAYKKVCVINGKPAAAGRWAEHVEAFEKDVADGGKWAPFKSQYDRYVAALTERIAGQSHPATEAVGTIITRSPQREVDTVVDIDPRVRRYLFAVNGWDISK